MYLIWAYKYWIWLQFKNIQVHLKSANQSIYIIQMRLSMSQMCYKAVLVYKQQFTGVINQSLLAIQ